MRLPLYRFGDFELDPAARELRRLGERIALPPKSFECLAYLVAHRDRAVGRDELIAAVWGRVDITDTVVAQTMLRARKALGDSGEHAQRIVRTVPRFGYHWIAPVLEVAREAAGEATAQQPTAAPSLSLVAASLSHSPPRRRGWLWTGAAAGVLAVIGTGTWLAMRAPSATSPPAAKTESNLALVLPVSVDSDEGEDAWVRLGAMDYLSNRLRRGGLRVLPSEQALHLGAQVGDAPTLDAAQARRLQDTSGARWIVTPQAQREARGWRVRLSVVENAKEHVIDARGPTALAAVAVAADAWLRRLYPERARTDVGPSEFDQRVQQIDAELLAGQLTAARRLIETAPAAEREDPALQVRAGQIEFRAGSIDEAEAIFTRTLASAPDLVEVRAKAMMGLGAVAIRRGEFAKAGRQYTQALAVLAGDVHIDDPTMAGTAYNGLGVALVQQGRMDDAVHNMGLARIAMQRSGNLIEAASVGTNLGMIERQRRHYPQALQEFDGAIAVFERFDVRDYMAAALMSKADVQMEMVQPDVALASLDRARAQTASIGDKLLLARIALVHAQVQLSRGRLRDVDRDLASLETMRYTEEAEAMREVRVRLHLARGATSEAMRWVRMPSSPQARTLGGLALAAVQAALRDGDTATASQWAARGDTLDDSHRSLDWDVAAALLAHANGHDADALRMADAAMARVEQAGSPMERVQAGLLKARLLRLGAQPHAALAVLADLDAFASTDYGVAWEALALYRALGDPVMTKQALARTQSLRGERDIALEPAL